MNISKLAQAGASAVKAAAPVAKSAAKTAAPAAKVVGKTAAKVAGGFSPVGAVVTGGIGAVNSASDYDYSKDLGANVLNDLGESWTEATTDVNQLGTAVGMIASGDIGGGLVKGVIAGADLVGKGTETLGKVAGNVVASTGVLPHAGEVAAETTDTVHGTNITGTLEKIGETAKGSNIADKVAETADVLTNEPTGLVSSAGDVAGWAVGSKVYNTLMSTASGTVGSIGSVQSVTGKGSEVSGSSSAPAASLDDPSDSGSASKASAAQTAQASTAAADNTVSAPVAASGTVGEGITQSSVVTGAERAAAVAETSHAAGAYTGSSVDAARASGIDQRTINRERIARGREIMGLQ